MSGTVSTMDEPTVVQSIKIKDVHMFSKRTDRRMIYKVRSFGNGILMRLQVRDIRLITPVVRVVYR